jgi:hypothetical protein
MPGARMCFILSANYKSSKLISYFNEFFRKKIKGFSRTSGRLEFFDPSSRVNFYKE